ncbi:MAG: hypothetical protein FWG02_09340 [Holophagaceae bacterium]|nr:hypothetical protein [Holophagaceae bacterium]
MRFFLVLFILTIFLTGCSSSEQAVLSIETQTSIIKVGERISLSAVSTETLESPPEWEVYELDGGTFMRTAGNQVTYIAPSYAGTYRIIAKATRLGGEKVKAVQVIVVQPQILIEPTFARVAIGGAFSFVAKVRGVDSSKIQWSIDESDGGTITSSGIYTAPSKPGFYTVVATVMTDGRPCATATVHVE